MVDSRVSIASGVSTATSQADIQQAGESGVIASLSLHSSYRAVFPSFCHAHNGIFFLPGCWLRLSGSLLASAEKLVQEQADRVRQMKEVDGLTKGDPVLDEAVAELLQRKNTLQELQ